MAQTKWRLRKTLSRKLEFRPIENEDVSFAWAAYRGGALKKVFAEGLSAQEFKQVFEQLVVTRYDAAWTLFAETQKGFIPVGIALGFWPHREATPFMLMDAFVWFPWSSPRSRIESAVNFLNDVREDVPMMGFVKPEDKPFVEIIAKHGILNRVGTSYNIFPGERASIWETRGN